MITLESTRWFSEYGTVALSTELQYMRTLRGASDARSASPPELDPTSHYIAFTYILYYSNNNITSILIKTSNRQRDCVPDRPHPAPATDRRLVFLP